MRIRTIYHIVQNVEKSVTYTYYLNTKLTCLYFVVRCTRITRMGENFRIFLARFLSDLLGMQISNTTFLLIPNLRKYTHTSFTDRLMYKMIVQLNYIE
jgi:predicted GTPase